MVKSIYEVTNKRRGEYGKKKKIIINNDAYSPPQVYRNTVLNIIII